MRAQATSFVARGEGPGKVARAALEATKLVPRPSGGIVFASGNLLSDIGGLAERLKAALPEVPLLVAGGHGVLTERGEVERESSASGMLWRGGQTLSLAVSSEGDLTSALASALRPHAARTSTAMVFVSPRGSQNHGIDPLAALEFKSILGGGTAGEQQVAAIMPGRKPELGSAGALVLSKMHGPIVVSSPACRLLMPLASITRSRGSMVLELDGEPALEVLTASAKNLPGQPLVLAALAGVAAEDDDDEARTPLLVRGIQGVDPARQGVILADELRPGMRMAFAVRDAPAARSDLEVVLQRLSRETAGALPCFGLYLNCAGRGASLYGTPDVDVRLLKSRFPELPLAGMHSSFEIAPHEQVPTLQLYTGVLAMFTVPS
jgi:small ligand-binding sensory domain FIST